MNQSAMDVAMTNMRSYVAHAEEEIAERNAKSCRMSLIRRDD